MIRKKWIKKEIDKTYKKLYIKSERLVSYRTGYGYNEKKFFLTIMMNWLIYVTFNLFKWYKDSIDNIRSFFN